MTIKSLDRPNENNPDEVLDQVIPLIDQSGAVEALEQAQPTLAGGAPRTYTPVPIRAILIMIAHLCYAGKPVTISAIWRLIWRDYNQQQRARIGIDTVWNERDAARARTDAARDTMYHHLWERITNVLTVIDDNPTDDHTLSIPNREFDAQVRRNSAGLAHITAFRERVMNLIVAASIRPATRQIPGFGQHIAVDGSLVPFMKGPGPYGTKPDDLRPAVGLAFYTPRDKRQEQTWIIDLTCAVAVSDPSGHRMPNVTTAISLRLPSDRTRLRPTLSVIDHSDYAGFRPPRGSNRKDFVVGDKEYSAMLGLNEEVMIKPNLLSDSPQPRGRHLLARTPKVGASPRTRVLPLFYEDDTTGPVLFGGVPVCPGISVPMLRYYETELSELTGWETAEELSKRQEILDHIHAATMNTKGLPVRATGRSRGGQRKAVNLTKGSNAFELTVLCPADNDSTRAKVRCPIIEQSMSNEGKPLLTPPADPPTCCQQMQSKIKIDEQSLKQYKPMMEGSWKFEDFLTSPRSQNERYHGQLKRPENGALTDKHLVARSNGLVSIVIALHVAVTNLKEQDAYLQKQQESGEQLLGQRRNRVIARRESAIRAFRHDPAPFKKAAKRNNAIHHKHSAVKVRSAYRRRAKGKRNANK